MTGITGPDVKEIIFLNTSLTTLAHEDSETDKSKTGISGRCAEVYSYQKHYVYLLKYEKRGEPGKPWNYFWPEDLTGRKLILYNKKIREIPEYTDHRAKFEEGSVIVVRPWLKMPLKFVPIMVDTVSGSIYMYVPNFNKEWEQLRKNLEKVIGAAKRAGIPCGIENLEEIVDLTYLAWNHRRPFIRGNKIEYRTEELSEMERILSGRRQSLLDNRTMLYFYSGTDSVYHDRSCRKVQKISDADFCASSEAPQDKCICAQCRRTLYIRKGCMSAPRQVPLLEHIFDRHAVRTDVLQRLTDAGMTFRIQSADELLLHCREDSWAVTGISSGSFRLWHNNYIQISDTERYITSGFHDQKRDSANLSRTLSYAESYRWESHLDIKCGEQPAADEAVQTGTV